MSDRLLVLVRHGQSEWNLKNLFTGWKDPDLTEKGIAEARDAGQKLKAQGLSFDIAFTSVLKRAQHTLDLALVEIGQTGLPVRKHLALNERDYGDLSGLNKDDARKKWGEEQVHVWRRSYDVPPPGGESLKDTLARTLPYYVQEILPVRAARRAHAGGGAWQFAARLDHGAGKAFAERNSRARTRHRRSGDLPPQRRRHRRLEARSGSVNAGIDIFVLATPIPDAALEQLAAVLVDCVEGGASVSLFSPPPCGEGSGVGSAGNAIEINAIRHRQRQFARPTYGSFQVRSMFCRTVC